MPTYVQITFAAMASLLVHIALVMGLMQQAKVRPPHVHGLMQVALHFSANETNVSSSGKAKLSEASKPDLKPDPVTQTVKPKSDVSKPIQTAPEHNQTSGHFRWRPPSAYQQSDIMNAMQLQQIAFQRKAQAAAVLDGMSKISSQLAPIITTRIDCTQQANDEIDCFPEPNEKERSLVVQFLNLAIQAHRLGITGNPVNMDFDSTLGVSVTLR